MAWATNAKLGTCILNGRCSACIDLEIKGEDHMVMKTVTVSWLLVKYAVVLLLPSWDCTLYDCFSFELLCCCFTSILHCFTGGRGSGCASCTSGQGGCRSRKSGVKRRKMVIALPLRSAHNLSSLIFILFVVACYSQHNSFCFTYAVFWTLKFLWQFFDRQMLPVHVNYLVHCTVISSVTVLQTRLLLLRDYTTLVRWR